MTEKQLLTKKDLAERWGVSEKAIDNWRKEGVVKEVKGIPVIRFNLEHIRALEGTTLEPFSPLERKRLERELETIKKERDELKGIISNILVESSKVVNFVK